MLMLHMCTYLAYPALLLLLFSMLLLLQGDWLVHNMSAT
jgi:hypothetical protein